MSRLYYPSVKRGTLAGGGRLAAPVDLGDATNKVVKNIPTELVTTYGALVSAAMTLRWTGFHIPAAVICLLICWVLTPLYLNKVADKGKPKRNQIITGTIAFPIWAYLVSGNQVIPHYYDASLATIIAILFGVIVTLAPMNE